MTTTLRMPAGRSILAGQLPAECQSGVYAARLRTEGGEDHIPFFIRPPRGRATADIAFLAPTNSYLAYANEQLTTLPPALFPNRKQGELAPDDHYIRENRLLSLYDSHADGSGVCYSSRLRPIINMRPRYHMRALNCPHQLPADLHLIDWLEAKGHAYDVITDEDLHAEGLDLLAPYKVIITGSHPEYWSGPMLDALETYLHTGGRLMYLGGNGFYWITSFCSRSPPTWLRFDAGSAPGAGMPGPANTITAPPANPAAYGGTGAEHLNAWSVSALLLRALITARHTSVSPTALIPGRRLFLRGLETKRPLATLNP